MTHRSGSKVTTPTTFTASDDGPAIPRIPGPCKPGSGSATPPLLARAMVTTAPPASSRLAATFFGAPTRAAEDACPICGYWRCRCGQPARAGVTSTTSATVTTEPLSPEALAALARLEAALGVPAGDDETIPFMLTDAALQLLAGPEPAEDLITCHQCGTVSEFVADGNGEHDAQGAGWHVLPGERDECGCQPLCPTCAPEYCALLAVAA